MSPAPDLTIASDDDIVALARQGSEGGHRELVRRFRRTVLALIRKIVGDRDLAEDLTQDTFIKAIKALDRYRPGTNLSAWIMKIANNTALDHARTRQVETESLSNTPERTPTGPVRRSVIPASGRTPTPTPSPTRDPRFRQALEQAIKKLRKEYRRCITLRYLEERSIDDIAETLHLPKGTVTSHLHRGRTELKAMLGDFDMP